MPAIAMEKFDDIPYVLAIPRIEKRDCLALSCTNKRLSEVIPYEKFRLDWNRKIYPNPLEQLLVTHNAIKNEPKGNRYLRIAECFLRDGASPNGFCPDFRCHLLHEAAKRKDKDFARVLLRYGADPYEKISLVWHCYLFNAFHFARVGEGAAFEEVGSFSYDKGSEPAGWLLELCREVEEGKERK